MTSVRSRLFLLLLLLIGASASAAEAQTIESVGDRALGMGGAFVAVATDSTATWWNPGALAAGPFVDVALAHAVTETRGDLPAFRNRATWFSLGTPPVGVSYYRFQVTNIAGSSPTVQGAQVRESTRTGTPVESLSASQLGVTLVHSLADGIHVGTTLKYVRGTVRTGTGSGSTGDLLDSGDALGGGAAQGTFDLDLGAIGVWGPVRIGAVARNLRAPEFGDMRLPRQYRVGAAYDAEQVGALPLTVAVDADVRSYQTGTGERRVIAAGAEQWLWEKRLGVRAGARFNTVGAKERAATAGVSYAVRAGLYVEAHVVRAGAADERGWGLGARVSF